MTGIIRIIVLVILSMHCLALVRCEDIASPVNSSEQAEDYLRKYAYIGVKSPDPEMVTMTETNLTEAMRMGLMGFQRMAGVSMTGQSTCQLNNASQCPAEKWTYLFIVCVSWHFLSLYPNPRSRYKGTLDNATMEMMNMRRCGNMDMTTRMAMTMRRRRRRYAVRSRWYRREVSYKISGYSDDLDQATTDQELERAAQLWDDASGIKLTRIFSGRADIDISFAVGDHGDGDPFDGPRGTLAHAFYPTTGTMHFDDAETFTVRTPFSVNLFQVAAHEFGHSLGIDHSDVRTALMAPFYDGYIPDLRLDPDDIMAIRALYGDPVRATTPRTTSRPRATTTTRPVSVSETYDRLCAGQLSFDALTTYRRGACDVAVYGFVGNEVVRIMSDGGVYIIPIADSVFNEQDDGPTSGVDAAAYLPISRRNGELRSSVTYLFKNNKCWAYDENGLLTGYPALISAEFPGIPDNIDAAFRSYQNGHMYFFKGEQYYRYDDGVGVTSLFPRLISRWWPNVPTPINTVIEFNLNETYFIRRSRIYQYNSSAAIVQPGFPRLLSTYLSCPDASYVFPDLNECVVTAGQAGVGGHHWLTVAILSICFFNEAYYSCI